MSDNTVRGRVASPRTVAVRALLDQSNGEVTFSTALPQLQAQGVEIDQNYFNVIKSAWRKARQKPVATPKSRKAGKVRKLPEVTVEEAVAFVTEVGGLVKAEAKVLRELAMVKTFKRLLKLAA